MFPFQFFSRSSSKNEKREADNITTPVAFATVTTYESQSGSRVLLLLRSSTYPYVILRTAAGLLLLSMGRPCAAVVWRRTGIHTVNFGLPRIRAHACLPALATRSGCACFLRLQARVALRSNVAPDTARAGRLGLGSTGQAGDGLEMGDHRAPAGEVERGRRPLVFERFSWWDVAPARG